MKNYLKGWNFMRILRFVLGIFILVQSFYSEETLMIVLGVVLTLMPVFNLGGCASGQCYIPSNGKNKKFESTHVEFEEVKKSN